MMTWFVFSKRNGYYQCLDEARGTQTGVEALKILQAEAILMIMRNDSRHHL